ncbi:cation-translocating P-type ATPase [Clostridiaceae bacterium UIB06]|uniref:Cd(2+)-exporting ATPase n=1 Tax=Clostridium thailandense TaxID=2794346 RepID=A0A949TPA4_9CLOT|nr:cation-translocating P-type ATPase [Clostridium thailandense]MBV7272907.1 cation-translocating P-type ATPase [Clostridium thailandense]MCH5136283.1 cation-translocating P-type ATPase [Clostridiaceae bacterium UIB06]
MKKLIELFKDEDKRVVLFLISSAISLIISFLHIGNLKIDAAWLAIILCGIPIIKGAAEGLIREFDIKADVLVALALIASVSIGQIFAAGEVAFIMTLGALLEDRTVAKARAGIEKLVHLTPRTARVICNGSESIIPAEEVQVGDTLRVLAGETIAVDGVIISGQTSINQAVMTGEALPVDKGIGDEVSSGTINQFGTFDMKATKVGADSSLQRMIRLVESADASKAKIVGMADRWATWIVVIALLSSIGTWFVTGEVIRSVTILVVFCPCALVLATPTAIMAGIGNATKYGILVREGDALERLSKVHRVAFDKTGTLTYGKPAVVAVESFNADINSESLLELTASAELRSEHPLGRAIVSHFKNISKSTLKEPQEFAMLAGRGVKALISDNTILAGNAELLVENSIVMSQDMLEKASKYKNDGCTIIYISANNCSTGFIALSDTLRKDSIDMIKKLKSINIESILLTGDNPQAASYIAKSVGITNFHAECLPEDKLLAIENYQNQSKMICMVGDGINDAPALKKAYVGIAMGGIGSDIAVDAADIALVSDDIKSIPHLLSLSQKTMSTIKWNLSLSMLLNFVAIILAMTGILNPILGALVHNIGSVAVIINSALLLNFKNK